MKILHACDSIIGGTGSYLAELLPHQGRKYGDGSVTLLMPASHMGHVEESIIQSNVRLITFPRRNRLHGMVVLLFAYLYHWWRIRPDIVHAHSFGAGVVTRVLRPFTWFRTKLIYCPHGWSFDMRAPRWRNILLQRLERFLALFTTALILISGHEHKRAREIGIPEHKLFTVLSGIAPAIPDAPPASWQDNRLKLLFVGRFDEQKGLDILLEAITPLGDRVVLRTIGSTVVSNGFDPTRPLPFVEYLGWLPRDQVAAHMRASDFLVVPSRWEGFGLVALEAMRLSLPVIASRVGGLQEIVAGGQYGPCFSAGDALELRQIIENLTPADVTRWKTVAHRRFIDSYTSDRMTSSIDAIYQKLSPPR